MVNIVQQLQQRSVAMARKSKRQCAPWNTVDRIRVITFYQAQVSMIRKCLFQRKVRGVVVATVDSSQGCEADIVIVSFVRSQKKCGPKYKQEKTNKVGFLSDDRRMNVAITRGKYIKFRRRRHGQSSGWEKLTPYFFCRKPNTNSSASGMLKE